jgi:hypothetical protein
LLVFKTVIRPSFNVTTEPENGTRFTDLEGSMNATTFTCNIFDPINSEQLTTVWRLQRSEDITLDNISSSEFSTVFHTPDGSYKDNQLTVRNLTSRLDGVTIYCGTEAEDKLAFFTLRINREFMIVSRNT